MLIRTRFAKDREQQGQLAADRAPAEQASGWGTIDHLFQVLTGARRK